MKHTLKQKLDREFRKYVILGACNPPLADRALHAEPEIGLLLSCNVIVYETEAGRSVVAAMAPIAALGIVGENAELQGVAREAEQRLRRALASYRAERAPEMMRRTRCWLNQCYARAARCLVRTTGDRWKRGA